LQCLRRRPVAVLTVLARLDQVVQRGDHFVGIGSHGSSPSKRLKDPKRTAGGGVSRPPPPAAYPLPPLSAAALSLGRGAPGPPPCPRGPPAGAPLPGLALPPPRRLRRGHRPALVPPLGHLPAPAAGLARLLRGELVGRALLVRRLAALAGDLPLFLRVHAGK